MKNADFRMQNEESGQRTESTGGKVVRIYIPLWVSAEYSPDIM
jgi:hypothetical protein